MTLLNGFFTWNSWQGYHRIKNTLQGLSKQYKYFYYRQNHNIEKYKDITPQQRNITQQQRSITLQQRTLQQRNITPQQRNITQQQRNITLQLRTLHHSGAISLHSNATLLSSNTAAPQQRNRASWQHCTSGPPQKTL